MSQYTPDKWVLIKAVPVQGEPIYKIFACWYGGFTGADSWKLSSGGVTAKVVQDDWFELPGYSGSVYNVHVDSYGTSSYGAGVLETLLKQYPNILTSLSKDEAIAWLEQASKE